MTLNLRFSLGAGMTEDMGEGVAGPTVLEHFDVQKALSALKAENPFLAFGMSSFAEGSVGPIPLPLNPKVRTCSL